MTPYIITTNSINKDVSVVYDDFGLFSESLEVFAERFNIKLSFLKLPEIFTSNEEFIFANMC